MRIAVLGDVHANLAALEAALTSVHRLQPDRILCLGDIVGYHAQPRECLQLVREGCDAWVVGNHDRAAAGDRAEMGTSHAARRVMEWTREVLGEEERAWLRDLPRHRVDEAGVLMAHGCFLNDAFYRGYTTSTMLPANLQAVAANPEWPLVAVCGHTHVPMCGWLRGGEVHESHLREPAEWPSDASAVLLNPGAVGQPRDGDPRAAFAVLDLDVRRAEVHRVPYDLERTAGAMHEAGLPRGLVDRLREGR